MSLQISRLFFCNAIRRFYEFQKQTGRNANPSFTVQSLYNIVDSIFVARLSETALTAASLVYSIQFLMIAVGVGTAVGLNALLSRKIGEHKPEEACRAATTGLFLMIFTSLIFSIIGIFLSDKNGQKYEADLLW